MSDQKTVHVCADFPHCDCCDLVDDARPTAVCEEFPECTCIGLTLGPEWRDDLTVLANNPTSHQVHGARIVALEIIRQLAPCFHTDSTAYELNISREAAFSYIGRALVEAIRQQLKPG